MASLELKGVGKAYGRKRVLQDISLTFEPGLTLLVGPSGAVHGVELEPELVRFGSANLAATDQPWASIVAAEPGVLGLPQLAPFDRILVSAEPEVLPQTLVEQLGEGGVMVIPVAGVMLRVRRRGMHIERSEHGFYAFVPLR